MTTNERLYHLNDYLGFRIDIIAEQPKRWLGGSYYQLPTFEYYLVNCVDDKGGSYDFTRNNYKYTTSPRMCIDGVDRFNAEIILSYSYWMGTPFNFKTKLVY